jgi:hypothetical protein
MIAVENTLKITPNGTVLRKVDGEWVVLGEERAATTEDLSSAVTITLTTDAEGGVISDTAALAAAQRLLAGDYSVVDGIYPPEYIILADGTTTLPSNKGTAAPLALGAYLAEQELGDVRLSFGARDAGTDIALTLAGANNLAGNGHIIDFDLSGALDRFVQSGNTSEFTQLASTMGTVASLASTKDTIASAFGVPADQQTAVAKQGQHIVTAMASILDAKRTEAMTALVPDQTDHLALLENAMRPLNVAILEIGDSLEGGTPPTIDSIAPLLPYLSTLNSEQLSAFSSIIPSEPPIFRTLLDVAAQNPSWWTAQSATFTQLMPLLSSDADSDSIAAALPAARRFLLSIPDEAARNAVIEQLDTLLQPRMTTLLGEGVDEASAAVLATIARDALTAPDDTLFTQLNSLIATIPRNIGAAPDVTSAPINMGAALDVVTTWAQQSPENAARLPELTDWVSSKLPDPLGEAAKPLVADVLTHLPELTAEEQQALGTLLDGTEKTPAQMLETFQTVYLNKPARDLAAALPTDVTAFDPADLEVQAFLARYNITAVLAENADQAAYEAWLAQVNAAIDAETTRRQTLVIETITQAGGESLQALDNLPEPVRGFVLALAELFRPLLSEEMRAGLDVLNGTSNQTAAEIRAEEAALGGQFPIPDSALMDASSAEAVAANAANDNAIAPEAVPTVTSAIPAPTTLAPVVQQPVTYNPADYPYGITPKMIANDYGWAMDAGQNISVANLGQLTPTLTPTNGLPRTRDQQLMAA